MTGNEGGAHQVVAELARGVSDIGFTVLGPGVDVLDIGAGPGHDYSDTDHGHEWHRTASAAVYILAAAAGALGADPIPAPTAVILGRHVKEDVPRNLAPPRL